PTLDDVHLVERASQIALIAIEHDRSRTALKEAIVEIKKSEAELKTIVSMIPQIVVVLAPDGTTQFVNQLALDYTGLSANEATGPDFRRRVFHPEDVERLKAPRAKALARACLRTNNAPNALTVRTGGSSFVTVRCATIAAGSSGGTAPQPRSTIGSRRKSDLETRTW